MKKPVPHQSPIRRLRCAVYTRKSTEEGLDMAFNSLDAQREACEAFVQSQRAEGWTLVPDYYDDGGFSGGTLERPALKRLMADIEAGLVDIVVVYKIDRLSRSLMDFSKLVEVFDRNNVSFVSVTQSFNTQTSMGRLTLNMLLSFAQFEREVIGERIRDKFAASRKRGIWMGGWTPLGYEVKDRKLIIKEPEASLVRSIFERFARIGELQPRHPEPNSTLVRAIARAWRWQKMLESGACATITELAAAAKVRPPFVSRMLRLNLLAPEIVEDVLDGRSLLTDLAELHEQARLIEWSRQRRRINGG